jgi:septum formation protein
VLASASPRRLDLLRLAGFDPLVRPAEVDESVRDGEDPAAYVRRLAVEKASAVPRAHGEIVLAADTTVVLDGHPIGKPGDPAEAASILTGLSGRSHEVVTGVAVTGDGRPVAALTVTTTVTFAPLGPDDVARYVASGEPMGKAGAYAIQGRAAALVERIEGSWTNVVGLPLVEATRMLRNAGLSPTPVDPDSG